MKKHLKAIISLAVALPIILYATGLLAQFIININAWKAAGSNYRVSPGLPSLGLIMNLKALARFPENLIAFGIIAVGLFVFFVFGLRIGWGRNGVIDPDRNLTVSGFGSYGTASFMSSKESESCFDITTARRTTQDILGMTEDGKILTLPANTRLNSNLAVCGASGTGKSRSISRNLIFQAARRGESIIVTDPKSELYESMSRYLRDQGYEVRVFNLVQMDHSDSWNCLDEVGNSELLAQTFADVVLKNISGEVRDPFWYNAELNLLKALVLYVALELPPKQRNLGTVYDLLCNESERSLSKIMESIRHEHTNSFTGEVLPPSPAAAPFSIFKQSSETVRTSVIIGLGSKLSIMQSKQVRDITSYHEIDLELPGKKKCAYFCIVSDQDSTFDFLSSLFFSFLFIKLIRYADGYCEGGVLNPKVKFILDEFPNCCLIPDFTKKCSTIRSRGCSVAVFFQNVGQMKNRYPDDQWQEILGACDSTVFLGCTDILTAEYISDRVGVASVEVEGTTREMNTMRISNYTPRFRRTNSLGRRQLLTPDEVLRMPPDRELIFIRGQKVMRARRFDYSLHPEYKRLKSEKAIAYEPDWETRRAFSTPAGPRSEPTLPQKQPKAASGQKEPPEPALQIDKLRCVDESDIF
jgi:type IV secretion system protein VirD4